MAVFAGALIATVAFAQQNSRQMPMPDLAGAIAWLNSAPLNGKFDAKSLRRKVVLVNFWTYTCINSIRPLPYLRSWEAKYKAVGFVVIGVHTPEFSFEKD